MGSLGNLEGIGADGEYISRAAKRDNQSCRADPITQHTKTPERYAGIRAWKKRDTSHCGFGQG